MMAKSMTVYEVVRDEPGNPFDPIGFQMSSLADVKKKLKTVKVRYPDVYIAKITYARYVPAKKGR
ncbi:MAG: hypothetical protein H8K11_01465 [Nitrospira sp.]|nr:hypothetical protein [Nitrospira sp.]